MSQDTKSFYKNQLYLYILEMNNRKIKFQKQHHLHSIQKYKILGKNVTKEV